MALTSGQWVSELWHERITSPTDRQFAEQWAGKECTLDGKPAKVVGRLNAFAGVALFEGGPSVQYSWHAVDRIMREQQGQFVS